MRPLPTTRYFFGSLCITEVASCIIHAHSYIIIVIISLHCNLRTTFNASALHSSHRSFYSLALLRTRLFLMRAVCVVLPFSFLSVLTVSHRLRRLFLILMIYFGRCATQYRRRCRSGELEVGRNGCPYVGDE